MDDLYVGLPDSAFCIDLPDYKWETVLDSAKYLFFFVYVKSRKISLLEIALWRPM